MLGEEAWRDCVGECARQEPAGTGAQCTWSNMELVLFGIDVARAQGWQLQADGALQEAASVRTLEARVAGCAKSSRTLERLKEKLRVAKWRFSVCVLEGMRNRMQSKVQERMRALAA